MTAAQIINRLIGPDPALEAALAEAIARIKSERATLPALGATRQQISDAGGPR